MTRCAVCGVAVEQSGRGRRRRYRSVSWSRRAEVLARGARLERRRQEWLADVEAGAAERPWWLEPEAADVLAELS